MNVLERLRVVLVAPRNPLNIGAVARAMSNFGASDLRLVNPYEAAFREARSAVRSTYILASARVFETVAEAVADCTLVAGTTSLGHRDLHIPLYRLEAAAPLLAQEIGPIALLFGSEKFGLSNDDLSFCHWALRIPAREQHASMNLGQAAAICLYELARDSAAAIEALPSPSRIVRGEQAERATELLGDLLEHSGYIAPRARVSGRLKLRRLLRRVRATEGDAKILTGMLRQIHWKLRTTSPSPDGMLIADDEGTDKV